MTALLLQFGPYLLAGIAALFGALKWRSSIIRNERAKVAAKELAARDISDEIEDAIAGRTPAENRERLRQWSRS